MNFVCERGWHWRWVRVEQHYMRAGRDNGETITTNEVKECLDCGTVIVRTSSNETVVTSSSVIPADDDGGLEKCRAPVD